jgi:hypothetical protein
MSRINIRQKGQTGEREIANALNNVVISVREKNGLPPLDARDLPFQRNQNQTAVGGSDLSNPFNLAIEVKRQEQLSVAAWWKQCLEQSNREGSTPILVYRQNNKPWRCKMFGFVSLPAGENLVAWRNGASMAVEIPFEDFIAFFEELYNRVLFP